MKKRLSLSLWAGVVLAFWAAAPHMAAATDATQPEREIVVAFEYPGRIVNDTGVVDLKLILKNNGRKDETVSLNIQEQPDNWQTRIEHFSDRITAVFLPAGEKKTLDFHADLKDREEDQKLPVGQVEFMVVAKAEDGHLQSTAQATILIESKKEKQESADEESTEDPVEVTTSYPSLRGATDSDFEFSVDVRNNADSDEMFTLRSEAPQGWDVAFKPGYENKYIGTFQIKANLSQSIKVEVKPAPRSEAGEYPIKVFAESAKGKAAIDLTVTLTGTHEIRCRTLNGVLSLSTRKGKDGHISMYVMNEGSAVQDSITFTSFKPENWEVTFDPERLESLAPGDMKQVEVKITPAAEALVGDYSVSVNARGEGTDDDMELRVTVKASATWGWIGIVVIVGVVLGLGWTFKKLGRR